MNLLQALVDWWELLPKVAQERIREYLREKDRRIAELEEQKEMLLAERQASKTYIKELEEKLEGPVDFCLRCGARIPPLEGEATCPHCDPGGCGEHAKYIED